MNTPVITDPILTALTFLEKWTLTKFTDNEYQKWNAATFREFTLDLCTNFAALNNLTTNMVRGALFRVPYITVGADGQPTIDVALIPPTFRILGMDVQATNGTDAGSVLAGVQADPISFKLLASSTGTIDARLDEKATTTATKKAVFVRTSGTDEEKIASFPVLPLEDAPIFAGEVYQYSFPGGQTRLVEVDHDINQTQNPLPTGLDTDPNYKSFAPLTAGTSNALPFFLRISQATAIALDSDEAVQSGVRYAVEINGQYVELVGTEAKRFPAVGVLNGEPVRVDLRAGRTSSIDSPWRYIGDPGHNNISRGPEGDGITYGGGTNYNNTYGASHFGNTYGTNHFSNTFGYDHIGNVYGNNRDNCEFGNRHQDNIYGEAHFYNRLGHGCYHFRWGNNINHCIVGDDCQYIYMGNNCARVEVYNTVATAQNPLIIPDGTTDAVYRRGQLVTATGGGAPGAGPVGIDYANPVTHTAGVALSAADFGKQHRFAGTGVALWTVALPDPAGHANEFIELVVTDGASGMWAFQAADINGQPERRLWGGEVALLQVNSAGTGYLRKSGTTKPLCARIQANGVGNIAFGTNAFFTLSLPTVLYDQSPGGLMTAIANQLTVLRPGKYTLNGSFMGKYYEQNPELDLLCSFNGNYANLGTLTDLGSCYQPANVTANIRLKITGVMNLQAGNFYSIQLFSQAPGELDNRGNNPSYIPALELVENPSWT